MTQFWYWVMLLTEKRKGQVLGAPKYIKQTLTDLRGEITAI